MEVLQFAGMPKFHVRHLMLAIVSFTMLSVLIASLLISTYHGFGLWQTILGARRIEPSAAKHDINRWLELAFKQALPADARVVRGGMASSGCEEWFKIESEAASARIFKQLIKQAAGFDDKWKVVQKSDDRLGALSSASPDWWPERTKKTSDQFIVSKVADFNQSQPPRAFYWVFEDGSGPIYLWVHFNCS